MKKLFLLVYVIGLLVGPWTVVFAQEYLGGNSPAGENSPSTGSFRQPSQQFSPLVGIPGLTNSTDLEKLLNALYVLSVTGGALLAVLVITLAGFKYMATDSVGSKEDAKNDIKSALLGLIIILSTALILRTISGDVNFNVLSGMPTLRSGSTTLTPYGSGQQNQGFEIIPAAGCGQSGIRALGGFSCTENGEPVLEQRRLACVTRGSKPALYQGQGSFRPLTQGECGSFAGQGESGRMTVQAASLIAGGGTIYGYHTVTIAQLKTAYPNKTDQEILDAYKEKLRSDCQKISAGNPVEIYTQGVGRGTFFSSTAIIRRDPTFVCGTPHSALY